MEAAGTADGKAVADKIRELPVDDFFAKGRVREDGRMMHDYYVFRVKKPSESKGPWDLYALEATLPGDQAFREMSAKLCPKLAN